jgi:hypothetical protein
MFIVYSGSSMRDFNMKTAALEWERLGLRYVPTLTESGCFVIAPMSIGRWAQIFTLLSGRQPVAC